MSENVYSSGGLFVTRYAGPGAPGDRARMRWQFTLPRSYEHVALDLAQLQRLAHVLAHEVAANEKDAVKREAKS